MFRYRYRYHLVPRQFFATTNTHFIRMVLPNILITGTPGTGKTTIASQVAERTELKHVNVTDLVKEHGCHEGMDTEFDTLILDEDKLCDVLEPILEKGGCIIDFHTPDFFPERWFELVLVLRTNTDVLYDRLTARGYSDKKRNENMECEIMQVVAEQTKESYRTEIIHELPSNSIDELDSNVDRIVQWLDNWKTQNL